MLGVVRLDPESLWGCWYCVDWKGVGLEIGCRLKGVVLDIETVNQPQIMESVHGCCCKVPHLLAHLCG